MNHYEARSCSDDLQELLEAADPETLEEAIGVLRAAAEAGSDECQELLETIGSVLERVLY